MNLSKDAELISCCIYKQYLQRRKSGESKLSSKIFEDDFYRSDSKISSWNPDDIHETIRELRTIGYVKTYIRGFEVLDPLIIHMENRFKNGFLEVVDFISKFI